MDREFVLFVGSVVAGVALFIGLLVFAFIESDKQLNARCDNWNQFARKQGYKKVLPDMFIDVKESNVELFKYLTEVDR